MSNQVYPLTVADAPEMLFVATQSGPIQRVADNNGPITRGLVIINSPSAPLALTLAAPRPGPQIQGGDDGCQLRIIVAASAPPTSQTPHTVTCPTNAINGQFSTLTFVPDAHESVLLVAFNGVFWFQGTAAPS